MPQTKEPIIHVGWPRCASTFLKTHIFPNLQTYRHLLDDEYMDLGRFYLADLPPTSPIHKLPQENNVAVSGGHFITYEVPLPWRKYGRRMRQDIFVSNITSLFRDRGKLLFVIRRQDQMAESFLRSIADLMQEDYMFVDYPVTRTAHEENYEIKVYKKANLQNKYGTMLTESFDYCDLLKRITAHIPKERIKVLVYEELVLDPEKFYAELGQFLGEDLSRLMEKHSQRERASKTLEEIRNPILRKLALHKISRLIPGPIKKFARLAVAKKTAMSPEFKHNLLKLYRENNERLAREFDLDLKKYGYY